MSDYAQKTTVTAEEAHHLGSTPATQFTLESASPQPQAPPTGCELPCPQGTKCKMIKGLPLCLDINECLETPNGDCPAGTECINTVDGKVCKDMNECALDNGGCGVGYECINIAGSRLCQDINECAPRPAVNGSTIENGGCSDGYVCVNKPGSYSCDDINECAYQNGGCGPNQECTNSDGSYDCKPAGILEETLALNSQFAANPGAVGAKCGHFDHCFAVCESDKKQPGFGQNTTEADAERAAALAGLTKEALSTASGKGSAFGAGSKLLKDALQKADANSADLDAQEDEVVSDSDTTPRAPAPAAAVPPNPTRRRLLAMAEQEQHRRLSVSTAAGTGLVARLRAQLEAKQAALAAAKAKASREGADGECCPLCMEGFCAAGVRYKGTCITAEMAAEIANLERNNERMAARVRHAKREVKSQKCDKDCDKQELPPNVVVHIIP